MRPSVLLSAALLFLALPAPAADRSLSWRYLDVVARLDGSGSLQVTERQTIVFTGDWNGGERRFRLEPAQRLRFERLSRIDQDGRARPLVRGSLDEVDEYSFTDRTTLRWRSRLPTDAPFAETEITYVLEYALENVLVAEGDDEFLLDHDLAFPDRTGPILGFHGRIELDPSWEADPSGWAGAERDLGHPGSLVVERGRLAPGQSVVVKIPLRWVGAGTAPAVHTTGLPKPLRLGVLIAMALGGMGAAWTIYRHGRARGLFRPLPRLSVVDSAWLRENVFRFSPELVSTLWYRGTGPSVVAAVLARMAGEKKITMRVGEGDVLHLQLLAGRDSLEGYEARLVKALFFQGDSTDTERIRKHYRHGFTPAKELRRDLERQLPALIPCDRRSDKTLWLAVAALFVVALLLGAAAGIAGDPAPLVIFTFFPFPFLLGFSTIAANRLSDSTAGHGWRALLVGIPLLIIGGEVLWLAYGGEASALADGDATAGPLLISGLVLAWAGCLCVVVAMARTRLLPKGIALRRHLALARTWFARELRRPQPRLEDGWIPYLVALELGPRVDRWFRSHGADRSGASSSSSLEDSPSGAGSTGGGSWTGGGGQFSGGGASGSWAALGAVAAGVSAPSSSRSSSGSSSSGSSSSGGGGGGGW